MTGPADELDVRGEEKTKIKFGEEKTKIKFDPFRFIA